MSESLLSFLDEGNYEEIKKEVAKRWESLGLTDELQGYVNEKVRELFESEAKELLKDSDEEPKFPRIVKVPPRIFNQPEENESNGK